MTASCPRCAGSGQVLTGEEARAQRLASGLSLREVARRVGYDPAYLSDLERGFRAWNAELEAEFRAALAADPAANGNRPVRRSRLPLASAPPTRR